MLAVTQQDLANIATTTSFTHRIFSRAIRCRQVARGRYWLPAKTKWYTTQQVYGI